MKQFIVLAAVLPILLVFVAQFSLEAARGLRMNAAEDAVRAFCIEAAYYGGGGPAEAETLKRRLAQVFRTDTGEIFVDLKKTDETHIDWRVSFPVGDIMAGARLMGLSPAENRGRAEMSGTIVIAPPPPEDPPPSTDDPATPPPAEDPDPPPPAEDPEEPPPDIGSYTFSG